MSDQDMGYGNGYGEQGGDVTTLPSQEAAEQAAGKTFAGRTWALLTVRARPGETGEEIGQELQEGETGGADRMVGVRRIATLLAAAGVGAAVTVLRTRRQRRPRGLGRVVPRRMVWVRR